MTTTNTFDLVLKAIWIISITSICAFLVYGWVKGMYWEKEMKMRRRHR
ncbi:MAG: hypothetical protein H0X33_13985 [Taibaiella sp.]|nr:hypothetical protein [Taibaiella sp.]